WIGDSFGEEAIGAGNFVKRRHHEGVVEKFNATHQSALRASNDEIEVIETSERDLRRGATFRGARVHIIEMLESRGILQIGKLRETMPPGGGRLTCLRRGNLQCIFERRWPSREHEEGCFHQGSAVHWHSSTQLAQTAIMREPHGF